MLATCYLLLSPCIRCATTLQAKPAKTQDCKRSQRSSPRFGPATASAILPKYKVQLNVHRWSCHVSQPNYELRHCVAITSRRFSTSVSPGAVSTSAWVSWQRRLVSFNTYVAPGTPTTHWSSETITHGVNLGTHGRSPVRSLVVVPSWLWRRTRHHSGSIQYFVSARDLILPPTPLASYRTTSWRTTSNETGKSC